MKTDAELLCEFLERRAETAFAELVNRHIHLVYAAACRATQGNPAAAQDITQLVFIELARRAPRLTGHPTLVGWLYTTVRLVSANQQRSEKRRKAREEGVYAMNGPVQPAPSDPAWEELRPVLDDALHELSEPDRDAVLLRFFEGKSLREVGAALCLTENAARMRVERALEKLRKALAQRGIHSTESALTAALALAFVAAPPTLAANITAAAMTAAVAPAVSSFTLIGSMLMTKAKAVVLCALLIAAAGILLWQQYGLGRLARENTALHHELEQLHPLRAENRQLAGALQAADERARGERRELLRLRGQMASARTPGNPNPKDVPEAEGWRHRFEAAYMLQAGEVVRHIAPPFIPERDDYYRREHSSQASIITNAPDYFVFRQDDQGLHYWALGFTADKPKLETVLRHAVCLNRYQFSGPDDLLALPVSGDWVVRNGASAESQLAALEPLLREATGRNLRFEKQQVEDDVIVVQGSFAPTQDQKLDVFAASKGTGAGGGSGDLQQFLEALGDRLNVAFASEVQEQNQERFSWFWHPDSTSSLTRDGRSEMVAQVLQNLHQQTGLSFQLKRRPTQVWFLTERP